MHDELLSLALIGTGKGGNPPLPQAPALKAVAESIAGESPEQRLLTHAALSTAYFRAGARPGNVAEVPAPAPADTLPVCTDAAADLLADLLRDGNKELTREWLSAAVRARRRAPHRLLPPLLDLARREKLLRESIVSVGDERGRWLIAKNPDWQFATAESVDESKWETGTPEQRVLVLREVRRAQPERARDLLQKTWKDDPAEQRAEFLKELSAGLSMEDEPLLESLLDDRSKQVRTVAADLLGRLPGSRLVLRMIDRVKPLLTFHRGGLMSRARLDVTLPAEPDKAVLRDGIDKTAVTGTWGEKQGWLQQMLSYIPPAYWAEVSGLRPSDVIDLAAKSEFAAPLLAGISAAAARHPDPLWIDPLLRRDVEVSGRLNRVLLALLPASQFMGLAVDVLRGNRLSLVLCSDLINNDNLPLDPATSRLWVEAVGQLAKHGARDQWSVLHGIVSQCDMRLAPEVCGVVEATWKTDVEPWSYYRTNVERLLKVLQIRRTIQKEFTS